MNTTAAKKKSARRKPVPKVSAVRARKLTVPADLRPLRAGSMKFSKSETALMDRTDIE
jgi:hypothetical protein